MKRLMVLITALWLTVFGIAYAGDITLTSPLEITQDATIVRTYSWTVTPESIVVNLNYIASDGTIVKQEIFTITDFSVVTSPASCSDEQWTNQTDCEDDGDVWTPAVVEEYTHYSDLVDATIGAGAVGQKYTDVIEKAIRNKIKLIKSLTGTVE